MKQVFAALFFVCFVAHAEEANKNPETPARNTTPPMMTSTVNAHSLSEYGPCKSVKEAQETLKKAMTAMTASGGGILLIPNDAPATFKPVNSSQIKPGKPGITIYDYRQGVEKKYVPGIGKASVNPWSGYDSSGISRVLKENLSWQNCFATNHIVSEYLGGASSYMDYLSNDVAAGTDQKFFIPSIRGLFAGQTLAVTGQAKSYSGKTEWITVKKLGLEKNLPFFTADVKNSHPKGAIVYNKNVVNGFTIDDVSNCDNQSMSLIVNRRTYGVGDSFAVAASLEYQGGFMSGAGDEGGVVYAAEVVHDLASFDGIVEKWNPETNELTYKAGSKNPQKIGTSRPILNLNPGKAIKSGKIMIVPPGYKFMREKAKTINMNTSVIIGDKNVKWDESVIGRFIAIDDPGEYYAENESGAYSSGPTGKKVYRWWPITGLEQGPDGITYLFVSRVWWGTERNAGPTLFNWDNYTISDTHVKPMSYLIVPGALASDVRNGISGNTPGSMGIAREDEGRTLVLALSGQNAADFAADDPIIQPPDPDVWVPTGFRVRHFNAFPGMMKGSAFSAINNGKVQVGNALDVQSPGGKLEEVMAAQKDKRPAFESAVSVYASTEDAFRIRGPVKNTAFDLWQYDGNPKKISWRPISGAPSTLHADPKSGNFMFVGGDIDLSGHCAVRQNGISGSQVPARNLRGINVPVANAMTKLEVKFAVAEPDGDYSLNVQPNWNTNDWVTSKKTGGFTVEFSSPAPANAKIDWQLIR